MAMPMHLLLHEFAKTVVVKIFTFPYAEVCDLYCSGVDLDKWDVAQIGRYIGIGKMSDPCASVVNDKKKSFKAEFHELDPCTEDFGEYLKDKGILADIVCCLNHLQSSFESEERVKRLLRNVSLLLKPGGYFVGVTHDSSTIWAKYQKMVEASHSKGGQKPSAVSHYIRSENYVITFEVDEEKFPFFGKRYHLQFTGDMNAESHYLVHFPSLIRLAREADLDYIEIQNLTEFYDDNRVQFAAILSSFGANLMDPRGKLLVRSYDVLSLYSAFVFQKPDPDAEPPIPTPLTFGDNTYNESDRIDESGWQDQVMMDDKSTIPLEH